MLGRPKRKEVVRKNIQIKPEHFKILRQEADEKYEGNLSMLMRNILDWYIYEYSRSHFGEIGEAEHPE